MSVLRTVQKQLSRGVQKKYVANLQENTHAEVWLRSVWMLSCKFAAYFQNTFS